MADAILPEQLHPGQALGAYILIYPLAVGGMGSVWCAAHKGDRGFAKLVAIKTILHEFADEVEYARALRDEAQLAAALSHPHLCDVTDLGEAGGYPFLVMEWVDGASLAELLTPTGSTWQPLDPILASYIVADACAGLHALHEARDATGELLGAVHRDVSPQNILLTQHGHVKIADLGVAKARGQLRSRTRSGQLRGKFGYIAPEQLRREGLDRRVDVHALGCVLYLCLSGALPYPSDHTSLELLPFGNYPPLREICPTVPSALSDIVMRALQTNPDDRFPDALAMRSALEAWSGRQHREAANAPIARCLRERLGTLIARRNSRIRAAYVQFVPEAADVPDVP